VPAPGLVAFRDGRAVGWVSLGPREDFERLAHSTVLGPVDDCPVWSIVCFVVGRRERGHGIARALLDAAIDYARANGATMLEAYPADTGGDRIPSAYAYQGTLAMFERAGFRVVARRQSNPTTPVRPIVRLELRASSSRANSPGPGVDIVMRWRRSVPAEFRRYITEQRRRQHPELAICWYALLGVGIRSCGEGGPFLAHEVACEDDDEVDAITVPVGCSCTGCSQVLSIRRSWMFKSLVPAIVASLPCCHR